LITLPGDGNKISGPAIEGKLAQFGHGEHGAKVTAISITNATELGNIYRPNEVAAIAEIARSHGLKFHMDGARFANALVTADCTPAELTWKSGVDVLSFGGTKNGGMIIEAVVFFDTQLADDFLYRRKRAGQLLSKGRFLSAQMLAYLKDDLWLANARQSNARAQSLSKGINQIKDVRISQAVEANEVFAFMPKTMYDSLASKGAHFYEWPVDGMKPGDTHVRFVLSYATPTAHVEQFIALVKELA
jgi:threonine aldolase